MDEKVKKILKSQLKRIPLLVGIYRHKLQSELEDECVRHGGHLFWDWQEDPVWSIGGHVIHSHLRQCEICGHREYKIDDKYRDQAGDCSESRSQDETGEGSSSSSSCSDGMASSSNES